MSDIVILPPVGYQPDELALFFTLLSPPFEWIIRRGEGWVLLDVAITFKDGVTRHVNVTIGKYPTYSGYLVDVRFKDDLLLELGLVDDVTPIVGRFETYKPVVGGKI